MAPFLRDETAPLLHEDEKEAIIEALVSVDDPASLKVICLTGMGGIGKTTLANAVYHDKKVEQQFDVKAWLRVSDDFDVFKILKRILVIISGTDYEPNCHLDHQNIILELKARLEGNKFLIVLDDVWNDDRSDWESLLGHLNTSSSPQGSRIFITTHNEDVASAAGAVRSFDLRFLSDEECWSLFSYCAFDGACHPELEEIGREIAKKCKGLPISATLLGSLLNINRDVHEWKKISQTLDDNSDYHFDILPAVKLSYDKLPLYLKKCLTYCSTLPENYEFDKEQIVRLWVAEGLVQSAEKKTLEEVAGEYFQDLVSRRFLLRTSDNISHFVVHDMVRDLAVNISKELFQDSTVQGVSQAPFEFERAVMVINIILEILLMSFDQIASPEKAHYALIALIMSLATVFICIIELAVKGRKQNITLKMQGIWCQFHCPSSSENPYTYIDAFVFSSAIAQFIFSSIGYWFLHKGADNPIKVSLASIIFIICLASSKLVKKPNPTNLPS